MIAGLTDIAGQLYVDPGRRDAFQALLHQNDAVVDFVSKIRRRDGSTIWISENARAVRNWAGQIVFYEGTVEDVTAKIEAEEAMRLALRQTDEASRAKSAFLAAMSHELKTPLNAVLGFSEMLKCELLGPLGQPAYRRYAEDIHVSGMRLLAVIDDILDVARVQTSAITLDVRPVPSPMSRAMLSPRPNGQPATRAKLLSTCPMPCRSFVSIRGGYVRHCSRFSRTLSNSRPKTARFRWSCV